MIRKAESSALNSSLGASFALVKKFGNNRLKSSFIPNFFTNTKLPPQFLEFARATPEATNTRICDLKSLDSANRAEIAESATFCHSKSYFCHSERSEESKNNLSLRADLQNLRGNPPYKKTQNLQQGLPRSHSLARNDKFLDSSVASLPQNDKVGAENDKNSVRVAESIKESQGGLPRAINCARNDEILDSSPTAQNDNLVLDSAIFYNQFFPVRVALKNYKKFLPNTALIALGANLKNPIATFKSLFTKLTRNAKIHILSTSPIYKNPPFGYANQPFFYNATILLATKMCLLEFYAFIFYLERIFGRTRKRAFKNAPRTLDIDIIFFNDIFMRSTKLNIPHPSWQTRASVLVPLIFQVHYKGF